MSSRGLIMTTTNLCTRKGGRHCLHFQEGDGDCCICEKRLIHCDCCGFAADENYVMEGAECAVDTNLCPTCGYDLCPGDEDCRQRKYGLIPPRSPQHTSRQTQLGRRGLIHCHHCEWKANTSQGSGQA